MAGESVAVATVECIEVGILPEGLPEAPRPGLGPLLPHPDGEVLVERLVVGGGESRGVLLQQVEDQQGFVLCTVVDIPHPDGDEGDPTADLLPREGDLEHLDEVAIGEAGGEVVLGHKEEVVHLHGRHIAVELPRAAGNLGAALIGERDEGAAIEVLVANRRKVVAHERLLIVADHNVVVALEGEGAPLHLRGIEVEGADLGGGEDDATPAILPDDLRQLAAGGADIVEHLHILRHEGGRVVLPHRRELAVVTDEDELPLGVVLKEVCEDVAAAEAEHPALRLPVGDHRSLVDEVDPEPPLPVIVGDGGGAEEGEHLLRRLLVRHGMAALPLLILEEVLDAVAIAVEVVDERVERLRLHTGTEGEHLGRTTGTGGEHIECAEVADVVDKRAEESGLAGAGVAPEDEDGLVIAADEGAEVIHRLPLSGRHPGAVGHESAPFLPQLIRLVRRPLVVTGGDALGGTPLQLCRRL